jgi:alkanesulfonate monooxygenase SsuD/methylene tetrahydromethanopterin reductase-like flavin-dependent oxidoreductase (luciferase family)
MNGDQVIMERISQEMVEHDKRYEIADEFLKVVYK